MGWYKGRYYTKRNNLAQMMDNYFHPKDYHFEVINKDKADKTVVSFIFSPMVQRDLRVHSISYSV